MTKTVISAATFKATCLEVLDQVAETGREVVVTKRGKPVARVAPIVNKPAQIVGAMKGEIEILGDIISPLRVRWKAVKG
jgi:prevent-host-death family protein